MAYHRVPTEVLVIIHVDNSQSQAQPEGGVGDRSKPEIDMVADRPRSLGSNSVVAKSLRF